MSLSAIRSSLQFSKILSCNKILFANSIPRTLSIGQKSTRTISRSLYLLCRNRDSGTLGTVFPKAPWSNTCSCGCSVHTRKGDEELAAFLTDEIENEKKIHAAKELPIIEGFELAFNESEVTFTKKMDNETIVIKSNVNNSVDADDSVIDGTEDVKDQQEPAMKATPEFTIEIKKGKKTLSFFCTYNHSSPEEANTEPYNDSFQISELSLYEGEFEDSTYTVSGDIMDGYLYDLLMNYLEERGISNDFADKMIFFFTAYEHKLYVSLLQGLKSFVEKN